MAPLKSSLVVLVALSVACGCALSQKPSAHARSSSATTGGPVDTSGVSKTRNTATTNTQGAKQSSVLGAVPSASANLLATAMRSSSPYRNAKGLEVPGPCWDARRHAAIVREIVDEGGTPYVMAEDLAFDLDDDGKPDPVLAVDHADGLTRYELYVQNGECANHVSALTVSGTIRLGRGSTKGLRNLELDAACDSACCDEIRHTELKFDGHTYVPQQSWTTPATCKK